MSTAHNEREARLNFRLSPDHKRTIEAAAGHLGQTLTDFAVSTLVECAREVIAERDATHLSDRDRDLFLAKLDAADAAPNRALLDAAGRHQETRG